MFKSFVQMFWWFLCQCEVGLESTAFHSQVWNHPSWVRPLTAQKTAEPRMSHAFLTGTWAQRQARYTADMLKATLPGTGTLQNWGVNTSFLAPGSVSLLLPDYKFPNCPPNCPLCHLDLSGLSDRLRE